jgi:serine protease Do
MAMRGLRDWNAGDRNSRCRELRSRTAGRYNFWRETASRRGSLSAAAIGAIGRAALGLALPGLAAMGLAEWPAKPLFAQEPAAASGLAAVAAIEGALVSAIASAEKSVVAIARVKHGERDDTGFEHPFDPFGRPRFNVTPKPEDAEFIPNNFGAGVVVDRNGLVLTNYHVLADEGHDIDDSDVFYVTTAARRVYKARKKAADPRSDLAVLSIDAHDLVPIKMGDGGALKKGQIVIALGNPYAIARDGQVSASWGIVSNLSRKGPPAQREDPRQFPPRTTLHQYGTLIQTDAKLNLGTSGGALSDLKGEMVGLLTATAALAGYEQSAGYAVPIDDAFRRVIETLKGGREVEYGFLGISPGNLGREDVLSGKHGMRVENVKEGTPASRARLAAGDIITHVNGQPIFDADGLVLQVGKQPSDGVIQLTIEHDGRAAPRSVELTKYAVVGKIIATTPPPTWRGMCVDYASAKRDYREHLLVTTVAKDSGAWAAGVRPDMHVVRVGNSLVTSPKQFHAAVAGKTSAVTITIDNGLSDLQITIAPGE